MSSSKPVTKMRPNKPGASFVVLSLVVHLTAASLLLSATLSRHQRAPVPSELRVRLAAAVVHQPNEASPAEMLPRASEPDRLQAPKPAESKHAAKVKSSAKSELQKARPKPHPIRHKAARVSTPMSVDGQRFGYPYYLNVVKSKLAEAWLYPSDAIAGKKSLRARVAFYIHRNGGIGRVRIERCSQSPVFDRSVLRAVEAAAPFPPLPDGYKEETLGALFVTFEYHK